MPRYKMVNGERIQLTAAEETARDAEEAAWAKQQAKIIKPKPYVSQRKSAYPAIGDQLDMLWHAIDQDAELKGKYFDFHQAILAVKSKYPK
tara:strand:+ start:563 stop:835 length:273 start_codon:yes stop_codon:yes gene_type:complete